MRQKQPPSVKNSQYIVALTWLARSARLLISVAFLYAGVIKLTDPQRFAVIIDGFGLLPESLILPIAIILPVLEIVTAAGLLLNSRVCLYSVAGLMSLFIAVLGYGISMGLDVDCGCFGPEDPEQAYHGLRTALYRDLGFLVPVLYLFWFQWRVDRRKTIPSF